MESILFSDCRGGQLDHFFDAMFKQGTALKVIHSRHEQGAGYMAYGYTQSSGRIGAYTVVPGPGLLNSTAALCTAYANNARVLCISGQVHATGIDSGYGHLHEIHDQLGLIRHLTKWAERIDHPTQAPDRMREAMKQLHSGRPLPVEIEMPMDIMGVDAEVDLLDAVTDYPRPPIDIDRVAAAAKILGAAKRPLIIVGSGALDAGPALLAVAEQLQAPVVVNRKGQGIVDARHYLSQNQPAGHRLWGEADAILGVGTRLLQLTQWGIDDDLKTIRIDIDPVEITRIATPDVGIVGGARDVLTALHDELDNYNIQRASRENELTQLKQNVYGEIRSQVPMQMAYLDVIRELLPEDGFFVDEVTQVGFVSWYGFPVYHPRHFITAGHQGTLGYGYATALGVAVANPGKKVVQVSGDGGFMFNVQELSTAVQNQLNVVTVIFNDQTFTNVQRQQDEWFEGRRICSDLHNPDFVKLAESFGATGLHADSPQTLRNTLERAFNTDGPVIIEVSVAQRMDSPWQFIMMPQNRKHLCR